MISFDTENAKIYTIVDSAEDRLKAAGYVVGAVVKSGRDEYKLTRVRVDTNRSGIYISLMGRKRLKSGCFGIRECHVWSDSNVEVITND